MSMNGQTLASRAAHQPPGSIVLPVADLMRYSEFFLDFWHLVASGGLPPGSGIAVNRSGAVVENLNTGIHDMPDEHEWCWLMGDDHRFPPDLLVQLLELDKDVAVPLCIKRAPPFMFGLFQDADSTTDGRSGRSYPGYLPYQPDEIPDEPFPVVASGSAGMLIRRPVLDAVGYPYFESSDGVYLNEDLEFCRRIRKLGFEVWCDPHAYLGHIGQVTIWPHRHEGKLVIKLDHGGPDGENEVLLANRRSVDQGQVIEKSGVARMNTKPWA